MFFGNMQSFYRRNSIYNSSSSRSPKRKEQIKRKHINKNKNDDSEDHRSKNNVPVRRNSFSVSRDNEYEQPTEEYERVNVPAIKISVCESETNKKSFNILKEKEKALWYNSSPALDGNSERLGPNKNNIIEETLGFERRKSGNWEE